MTKPKRSLKSRGMSTNYVTTGGTGYVPSVSTQFVNNIVRKGKKAFNIGKPDAERNATIMPKYKIPKNRFRVSTIRINNGILTGETDDQGNMYWFRNGKYITPNQMKQYKYYDSNIKGYRTLGTAMPVHIDSGLVDLRDLKDLKEEINPVYTPNLDYIDNKIIDGINNTDIEEKQSFAPNNKYITLRTKGKMNLATIPTNLLDSIAINAGRAGTNIKTGLGLVGKESTFGGFSIPLGSAPRDTYYSPYDLTFNHAYFVDPYSDYSKALARKYKDMYSNMESTAKAESDAKYALEHGLIVGRTPHYNENIMADAFERYSVNPRGYNPGQANYVQMVNNIGNEVFWDKGIQSWWKEEGERYYNRGLDERRRLIKNK